MKRYLSILTFLSLSLFNVSAQTALSDYRPGVTNEGAVYMLPKTAIRVNVLIEKSVYTPGEFSNYAMRYLRLKDVVQEARTIYRVVSVDQQPMAIADTTKAFAVKFNPKTIAPHMALSDDGRLLAVNAKPMKQSEFTTFKAAPKKKAVNPREFMSEEILAAGSMAKMAELTAREIYDLRENRNLLIKGQADFMPSDGAQMKLMLDRLEQQEQILTQMFAGTVENDTVETILTVIPDGNIQKQVLFRLSQKLGLVDADDLAGEPYYITVEDLKTVPPVDEAAAMKKKKKQPENGLYINVAGRMRSTIFYGRTELSVKDFPAPQFGNVELLSGDLFSNKHHDVHLWLNALTGNIEKLE